MVCNTIEEILSRAAEAFGPEDAVRYKAGKNEVTAKSYRQLAEDSRRFSSALASLGMQGRHAAIIGPTSYSWLTAFFGTVNSGSVAVPLDVSLPAEELCELICRADVSVLVADEARADVIDLCKERCPGVTCVISMQQEESSDRALSLASLLKNGSDSFSFCPDPDRLCAILFTSGTTGKSKGVMLTHRNLAQNATCLDMKIPPRTVLLSVLPIHHAYCLSMDILKGISLGSVICINDSLLRVAKNIKLFRPDMILMVPLMIETLAKKMEDTKDLPKKLVKNMIFGKQFHTICSGGAYLNPDYIDQTLSIVPVSQYNHAMEISGREGISLGRDEAVLNCDTDVVMDYARDVAKSGITLNIFGHDLAVDRDLNTETFQTTSIPGQMGILIVSDEVIPSDAVPVTSILNVQFANNPDAEKQWGELYEGIATSENPETWPLNMGMTKEEVFSQNIGLTTIIAYLAIYIGFVLVVECAAILAIQQLTAATDNRKRYQLLNKLGAPQGMVNGALFKQILIAFLFPLVLAIAHSLCALQEVVTLVQLFGHLDIGQTAMVVSGAFLVVYGLYFVLTYVAARGVIRSDR